MKVCIACPIHHPFSLKKARIIARAISPYCQATILPDTGEAGGKELAQTFVSELVLARSIVRGRYDAVHLMNLSWTTPRLLRLLLGGQSTIIYDASNIQRGVAETLGRNPVLVGAISLLERQFVRESAVVFASGATFAEYFRTHFGRTENVFFLPDPVGPELFATPEDRDGVSHGVAVDTLQVAYVSTFDRIRVGPQLVPRGWELVDAIARMEPRTRGRVALHLIGKGRGVEALRERARERGVLQSLTFHGFVPDERYPALLRSLDLGFMEDYDTLGYRYSIGAKVQEYMASGLAVLSGTSPEKEFLLRDQGLPELRYPPPQLEEPGSLDAYADRVRAALEFALGNLEDLRPAGLRNRERARRLFSEQAFQRAVAERYSTFLPYRKSDGSA